MQSVLSKEEAAHALDRLWQAKATVEAEGEETYLSFLDPNPSNIRVFYLMAVDKLFRDLISHPRAIDMVKSVLGEDFIVSNFTANIARPGSSSMALHSDQSLVFPDPWQNIWALNVIWCMHFSTPLCQCCRDFSRLSMAKLRKQIAHPSLSFEQALRTSLGRMGLRCTFLVLIHGQPEKRFPLMPRNCSCHLRPKQATSSSWTGGFGTRAVQM